MLFAKDFFGGADPNYRINIRVVTEYAWHSLFIQQLLIPRRRAADFVPEFTIVDLPAFKADPARQASQRPSSPSISRSKLILIGGTSYAGEMKKSVFTTLNYFLPAQGVMPMHCSANVGRDGDVALFFGLSGTGKTTLSADPEPHLDRRRRARLGRRRRVQFRRRLLRQMHQALGRGRAGNLCRHQPLRHGPGERGVRSGNPHLDFETTSMTENTRAAYPIDYIPNASRTGRAGHPKKSSC